MVWLGLGKAGRSRRLEDREKQQYELQKLDRLPIIADELRDDLLSWSRPMEIMIARRVDQADTCGNMLITTIRRERTGH